MKEDSWDKVLELYYGEDSADRQKVVNTGFNMDNSFQPNKGFYPFSIDGNVGSAGQLVLDLIAKGQSISDWSFDSISEGVPAGVTFVSNDRLFFSNSADIEVARSLLDL